MAADPVPIDVNTQAEIVHRLMEKLRAYYVFPDVAEQICAYLQNRLEAGEYADTTDANLFALALTIDVQEINHDEHLWVRWHPERLPDYDGPMYQNQEWQDDRRQKAELDNYGIHKAERLPGNLGYLDIREFYVASWAGNTVVAAMNFLANTSGLIIDLRKCRGGDPDTIALVCSYLFSGKRIQLTSLYWRDEDVTQEYWTLPHVPGKHFGDKPIYLLISKETFSGGEAFAYDLKTYQRATLVGETTGGGAHPGFSHRIHPHFEAFISNGRAINPISGTNWEGCGVIPDISVPQEEAFKVAYRMALESILVSLHEPSFGSLKALAEEVQLALKG